MEGTSQPYISRINLNPALKVQIIEVKGYADSTGNAGGADGGDSQRFLA
jgi:hypothetical protein